MGASAFGSAAATLRPGGASGKADTCDGITTALLPRVASCRICLEKSETSDMEAPCSCKGSMQYAHHACVQRWLNERPEKGSALCEVCGKPLKGNWQLWRAADDPLQLQLAALWRLLVHGSGAADARGAGEEWAAPAPGPGPGLERRRVSGSTAAGLGLLLAASGVLLLRQLLRVVPDTGESREHGQAAAGAAARAIEGLSLLVLLLWLAARLLVTVFPWCGVVHAARRSALGASRTGRQQAALATGLASGPEWPAAPSSTLLAAAAGGGGLAGAAADVEAGRAASSLGAAAAAGAAAGVVRPSA